MIGLRIHGVFWNNTPITCYGLKSTLNNYKIQCYSHYNFHDDYAKAEYINAAKLKRIRPG